MNFSQGDYLLCGVDEIRDALQVCEIPVLQEKVTKKDNAPRNYFIRANEIPPEKMQNLMQWIGDYVGVRKIPFAVF